MKKEFNVCEQCGDIETEKNKDKGWIEISSEGVFINRKKVNSNFKTINQFNACSLDCFVRCIFNGHYEIELEKDK